MDDLAFALAYFLAGVVVGLTLREAIAIARTGHTDDMSRLGRLVESTTGRRLGLVLVCSALIVNGVLGFLLIDTRADADARVQCESEFNRRQAIAQDARDLAARDTVHAGIALWEDLRAQIEDGRDRGTTDENREARTDAVLDSIDTYLVALRGTDATRSLASFPPPEFCRRLAP